MKNLACAVVPPTAGCHRLAVAGDDCRRCPQPCPALSSRAVATELQELELQALRERLTARLTEEVVCLFAELTGMAFSVVWPVGNRPRLLPCQRQTPVAGRDAPAAAVNRSRTCGCCFFASLDRCFSPGADSYQFVCPRGVRNFWLGLAVRGFQVAALVLQATPANHGRARSGQTTLAGRRRSPRADGEALFLPRLHVRSYSQACRLLRLVAHDLSQTLLAGVEEKETRRAALQLKCSETERVRLRAELHQHAQEAAAGPTIEPDREDRRQHSLRGVLAYVRANFTRPIQLRDVAAHMRLTETHISHLCSKGLGIGFKQYLTDLRMERAEELLADPRRQVAEVALQVGFTDANRFRAAFRDWAGLSPTAWRAALCPAPPREAAPLAP